MLIMLVYYQHHHPDLLVEYQHHTLESTRTHIYIYLLMSAGLYRRYLKHMGLFRAGDQQSDCLGPADAEPTEATGTKNTEKLSAKANNKHFLAAYHELTKVWTHPAMLKLAHQMSDRQKWEREHKHDREAKGYESIDDFVVSDEADQWTDDESNVRQRGSRKKKKKVFKERKNTVTGDKSISSKMAEMWWMDAPEVTSDEEEDEAVDPRDSGKLALLLQLLTELARGETPEKMLLFTQSLVVMELIQRMLEQLGDGQGWILGKDYFKLDGSTKKKTRQGDHPLSAYSCIRLPSHIRIFTCTCTHKYGKDGWIDSMIRTTSVQGCS